MRRQGRCDLIAGGFCRTPQGVPRHARVQGARGSAMVGRRELKWVAMIAAMETDSARTWSAWAPLSGTFCEQLRYWIDAVQQLRRRAMMLRKTLIALTAVGALGVSSAAIAAQGGHGGGPGGGHGGGPGGGHG